MKADPRPTPSETPSGHAWVGMTLALLAVMLACFHRSLQPGQILFASDGPLGANAAAYASMPGAFGGMWQDLNWIGSYVGSAFPDVTCLLLTLLGPLWFAKVYAPISLIILGLSAWLFLRQLRLRPPVCLLGGLAAALNSDLFSYACWGLGTHVLGVASTFLALAALVTPATRRAWVKAVLAGAAVGMAVMEGFDSGAILSLYVAAFVVFLAWLGPGGVGQRLVVGVTRTALVAAMAAFVATQALTILIGTQIQGVAGMEQDAQTRAQRWDQATMWSLPKAETLRIVIPGLYGYRMSAYDGSDYWGRVGETPGAPGTRHSGAGPYAGVLVVLLAGWGLAQSLRREGGPFGPDERRMIWFWGAATLISLGLAWGRHAPFYHLFYALPYASTIRNPVKFLHPFSLGVVILFAYGAEALWRTQMVRVVKEGGTLWARLRAQWAAGTNFDRRSGQVFAGVFLAGLMGWLLYASSRRGLEAHLARVVSPPELAPVIASFSLIEYGWFVLFLGISVGLLLLALGGFFAGTKARWATACFGLLLVTDLGRANIPWIQYWDFADKYSLNPLLEILRRDAHQHRVAVMPIQVNRELDYLRSLYRVDWLQHSFRYYNVQSLDDVQDPRPSTEKLGYLGGFFARQMPGLLRLWELTNTRYLLGVKGLAEALNQQADPARKPFRETLVFTADVDQQSGAIRVSTNSNGPFALMEYAAALPRARLYSNWEVQTNFTQTLERLVDPAFDPTKTVLLSSIPEGLRPKPAAATNEAIGGVEYVHYAPKRLRLKTTTTEPALLVLNDGFEPRWQATLDGSPQVLLRANGVMRGLVVPAGEHEVELRFRISLKPLLVSLTGIALALVLFGWVIVGRWKTPGRTGAGEDPRG